MLVLSIITGDTPFSIACLATKEISPRCLVTFGEIYEISLATQCNEVEREMSS